VLKPGIGDPGACQVEKGQSTHLPDLRQALVADIRFDQDKMFELRSIAGQRAKIGIRDCQIGQIDTDDRAAWLFTAEAHSGWLQGELHVRDLNRTRSFARSFVDNRWAELSCHHSQHCARNDQEGAREEELAYPVYPSGHACSGRATSGLVVRLASSDVLAAVAEEPNGIDSTDDTEECARALPCDVHGYRSRLALPGKGRKGLALKVPGLRFPVLEKVIMQATDAHGRTQRAPVDLPGR
jgi:hypothetical protein